MIDRALGVQPVVRRRKPDNTSQTSSNKNNINPAGNSPAKSQAKRLYQDQPIKNQDPDQLLNEIETVEAPTRSKSGKPSSRQTETEQQISSPAIKNIKMARVPLTVEDMKSSTKPHLIESAKHMEMRNSQIRNAGKPEGDNMYKLKLVVFLLISLAMVVFAMTPSRKGDNWKATKSRKERKERTKK